MCLLEVGWHAAQVRPAIDRGSAQNSNLTDGAQADLRPLRP